MSSNEKPCETPLLLSNLQAATQKQINIFWVDDKDTVNVLELTILQVLSLVSPSQTLSNRKIQASCVCLYQPQVTSLMCLFLPTASYRPYVFVFTNRKLHASCVCPYQPQVTRFMWLFLPITITVPRFQNDLRFFNALVFQEQVLFPINCGRNTFWWGILTYSSEKNF